MIESYFFIPGSHPKLIEKTINIKADNLIIDLEDAILKSDIQTALGELNSIKNKGGLWIRPVVFEIGKEQLTVFKALLKIGFRNFVLPKIRNLKQLKNLESSINNSILNELKIIILVENPECLLNLNEIIVNSLIKIEGIGFGSQDYCSETGMKHTLELLKTPRFQIMNTTKAHGIKSIDIVSMDSKAGEMFKSELREAFEMGYDGKFLIHPSQLEILKRFPFYTKEEVIEAEDIINEYTKLQKPAVFVYNNIAIEPPHIRQYIKIVKWGNNYGTK